MKRLFAVLLLLTFLFNMGGYFCLYKMHQYEARREAWQKIREGISENELVTLTFSAAETKNLHWKRPREFSYQGNSYDVVRKEKSATGETKYVCLPDHRETALKEKLEEQLAGNTAADPLGNSLAKNLSKLISLDYYATDAALVFFARYHDIAYPTAVSRLYTAPGRSLLIPPPEWS